VPPDKAAPNFLVRTCVDSLAGDGEHTIAGLMRRIKPKTTHQVDVRDAKGTVSQAAVNVKYQRLRVYPPIGNMQVCRFRHHRDVNRRAAYAETYARYRDV
jgi:hypothetical protein